MLKKNKLNTYTLKRIKKYVYFNTKKNYIEKLKKKVFSKYNFVGRLFNGRLL